MRSGARPRKDQHMTIVLEKITEDQVVGYMAKAKDPVTQGVTSIVEFINDKLPTVPAVPFAEQIPTPKEVIDNQYKFAKSVIDTQKDLALAVAKAAAPLTDKVLDRKSTVARKVAAAKK